MIEYLKNHYHITSMRKLIDLFRLMVD